MITKTESSYPYNRIESDNPLQLRLSESLVDILPHGSGIDYNWTITPAKKNLNRFYAHNGFHAMDEFGGYCHSYDFTLTIDYIPESDRKVDCPYCEKKGYRYVKEINKYHPGMNEEEMINWLNERFNTECKLMVTQWIFPCNLCNEKGYTIRHPFELIRLNFHGQREYTCCGYELKDYISTLICECLSLVSGINDNEE